MSDKKRDYVPSQLSPQKLKKKVKTDSNKSNTNSNQKENIDDNNVNVSDSANILKPPRSKKYFFGPRNDFSNKSKAPRANITNSQPKVLIRSDPSRIYPTKPIVPQDETKITDTPRKPLIPDGSDDQIYWETTPKTSHTFNGPKSTSKFHNTSSPQVPSSPIQENISKENDPVQSLFEKFNTDFHNIVSDTPKIQRRLSDSSSIEKSKFFHTSGQKSPTFSRSKTLNFNESIPNQRNSGNASILNRYNINKSNAVSDISKSAQLKTISQLMSDVAKSFDYDTTTDAETSTNISKIINSSLDLKDDNINKVESHANNTTDFSDLDDMSFILSRSQKLNAYDPTRESQNAIMPTELNLEAIEKEVSPAAVTQNPESRLNETSDFSDFDDSDLDNILNKDDTQRVVTAPVVEESKSDEDIFTDDDDELEEVLRKTAATVITKSLSTQDQSDFKNAAIFRRDINRSDSLVKINVAKEDNSENLAKMSFKRDGLHRFQILDILRNSYKIDGRTKDQVILTVMNGTSENSKIMIRGEYTLLDFQKNDIVHIIGENPKLVDDRTNLLIWNPDILISATSVGQSTSCSRRVVLNSRFSFPGEANMPMIVGNIVHAIFQECLGKNICTTEFINKIADEEIELNILNIYSMGDKKQQIKEIIEIHAPYIKSWFDNYYSNNPQQNPIIPISNSKEVSKFSVSNILDIEENIWSPMYGLKGKIDVTLEASFTTGSESGKFVTPLEIKTGKRQQISDVAQATLYTLLSNDRYDMDITAFLLVYTQLKKTTKHIADTRELKSLINLRNNLSQFLRDGSRNLPPLIKQSQCDVCYASEACMSVNKLSENGTAEESGLKAGIYDQLTLVLDNENYRQFYNHWDDLLTKEEGIISKLKKDLWLLTAKERETTNGKSVGGLTIKDTNDHDDSQTAFIYTFEKSTSTQSPSLQNLQLAKYDKVIISDEEGHFAIAQGFIQAIRPSYIIIKTDRRIANSALKLKNFNKDNNQTFSSVLHTLDSSGLSQTTQKDRQKKFYRIDKDDMFHGLALARYNLLNLFLSSGDDIRRGLIVDLKEPSFMKDPLPYELPSNVEFNSDQIQAFDKVLKTKDYSLILGMPGTGKTTVIAQIIRYLVQNGKTVLLASYTHSAVDNILIKLKDDNIPILRAGAVSRVHPDVRKFVPNFESDHKIKNYEDFLKTYMTPKIVATTCLGLNDIVFTLRKEESFDYCIIDEASQVSMPVCLGPLRFCDKFILVGDHYQLPPLVINPEARGLSKSLFKTLSETFPQSVVDLSYQYRMCADIMLLSNILIYNGKLKCGSEIVANQVLTIPRPDGINAFVPAENSSEHWMQRILKETNRVLFLNHDSVPATERAVGENIENPTEAELARQIVEGLIACGVEERSIGVMSLYRAQIRLLNSGLASARPDVEVLTADQFQGRDKDCVIISLVRSNDRNNVGDLLRDWRRVNVAITRARSKLIILGSKSTMDTLDTLKAFMEVIETRGWMHGLPPDAHKVYSFQAESQIQNQIDKTARKISQTLNIQSKALANRPVIKDVINDIMG